MNRIGQADLGVFPLCLGGNVIGWTADEPASFAIGHIDLYHAHEDDPAAALADTMAAFDSLVREGKARYVGRVELLRVLARLPDPAA